MTEGPPQTHTPEEFQLEGPVQHIPDSPPCSSCRGFGSCLVAEAVIFDLQHGSGANPLEIIPSDCTQQPQFQEAEKDPVYLQHMAANNWIVSEGCSPSQLSESA